MVRKLKIIVCIFVVCFIFSGCNFRLASSIDDLVSPIPPFGDDADVQKAMDTYNKNKYSLKTPIKGDYITSYSFYDIDKDGDDEAIAFYEPSDDLGTISMALIKKIKSQWIVVDSVKGIGKDVYSLSFEDVNGDKQDELIVCWNVISNSSNHELCIYKYSSDKDKYKLTQIDKSHTVNNYICVDMNYDKVVEMLLFEINTGNSTRAKAELFSIKGNKFKLLGETKLDSHIITYDNLHIESAENQVRVYADAIGSDGMSMLTEVIYWSDRYDSIVSPFYSYSTALTKETRRSARINSIDIDGDSLVEIPTDKNIKGLPKKVKAVDWKTYKNATLIHSNYSLVATEDGYSVLIPDDYINNISVTYNEKKHLMSVKMKSDKSSVFSVTSVLKTSYDKEDYKDFTIISEKSGYYYLAKVSKTNKDLTVKDIKKYFKVLI